MNLHEASTMSAVLVSSPLPSVVAIAGVTADDRAVVRDDAWTANCPAIE